VSFRDINERLHEGMQQVPDNPTLLEFICECGDRDCEEHVRITPGEFEQIRRDSRHFVIVPGHAIPDAERVISTGDRFEVVEKIGEAVALADAEDDRESGDAGLRDD
jgi:hypothetical protein